MRRTAAVFLPLILLAALRPAPAAAQLVADTLVTWRGYARTATCRVRLYRTPADEDRPHVVVLTELAENRGPSIVADASYLAERLGRRFGLDPTEAYWIFHWGAFSYEGADPDADKELFLRATFHRTESGRLSSPYWRVIGKNELREMTDRQFQE